MALVGTYTYIRYVLPPRLDLEIPEAGCDEAGRGCLAGPVFAAAVILPATFWHEGLDDSKKLSREQREELREVVEKHAISFAVAYCTPRTIDKINILNASFEAMHHALLKLTVLPEKLLIDGNRFKPFKKIPFECIVKGDGKIASIAACFNFGKNLPGCLYGRQAPDFSSVCLGYQ